MIPKSRLYRDIALYTFGWLVCVAGLVLPLYFLNEKAEAEPVPTEATALMISTFQETTEKLNTQLARCMSLIEICERSRLTFDAQMTAVFSATKEHLCK